MRVLIINGSVRCGQTRRIIKIFEDKLKTLGDIETAVIDLHAKEIKTCRGCTACLHTGEHHCPLKDDSQSILAQMDSADGIIFAAPNYALQIPALMKNLFDRFAFIFHRPRFFYKVSYALVVEGAWGGKGVIKYLEEVAHFWGFSVCKGNNFTIPWGVRNPQIEWPEDKKNEIEQTLENAAQRFYKMLKERKKVRPTWKWYLLFRITRLAHKCTPENDRAFDYAYFRDKGWFDAVYYCEAKVSWCKKWIGTALESAFQKMVFKK